MNYEIVNLDKKIVVGVGAYTSNDDPNMGKIIGGLWQQFFQTGICSTIQNRKFRNVHCRTWNMARKLKIMENEKHPLDDLKNDEITKKREK